LSIKYSSQVYLIAKNKSLIAYKPTFDSLQTT